MLETEPYRWTVRLRSYLKAFVLLLRSAKLLRRPLGVGRDELSACLLQFNMFIVGINCGSSQSSGRKERKKKKKKI